MSVIVDQTWVKNWGGRPTVSERDLIVSWLITKDKAWHPTLKSFPPFCLVKAKQSIEIPCPYSVGIVAGYNPDGTLQIRQSPDVDPVSVSADALEVVGYWKGLDQEEMNRFLS